MDLNLKLLKAFQNFSNDGLMYCTWYPSFQITSSHILVCQGAFQVTTSSSDPDGTVQQCRLWGTKTNYNWRLGRESQSQKHEASKKKKKTSQHCWHLTHKQNSVMAQQRWWQWLSGNTAAFASSLSLAAGETDSLGFDWRIPITSCRHFLCAAGAICRPCGERAVTC